MRLVRFGGGATGLLVGDGDDAVVLDVAAALPELVSPGAASWTGLIERWAEARGPLRRLEERVAGEDRDGLAVRPLHELVLEAPLPHPASRIFAMGGNFPMHVADTVDKLEIELSDGVKSGDKDDAPPWGFYVIPGTIVGPDAAVTPPKGTQKLDYEAEVGVVLTGEGPGVSGELPIWGYTAWNDFSIRDPAFGLSKVDHGPLTWSLQKNFATANACGPCMVVDSPASDGGLRIVCRVNGELRQDGNTTDMKHGFGEIAAHISEYLPLAPGDMILSGTPGGTAMEGGPGGRFLADGDVIEVAVTGVGVLRNRVSMP